MKWNLLILLYSKKHKRKAKLSGRRGSHYTGITVLKYKVKYEMSVNRGAMQSTVYSKCSSAEFRLLAMSGIE